MKTSVISLLIVCFLSLKEAPALKVQSAFDIDCRGIASDEGEPTYYELPSNATLTLSEFREMKKILLVAISQHNKLSRSNPDFSISPLEEYGVQYKVAITQKGEKEIWINGFCKGSSSMYSSVDLTSIPVIVLDGGSCYFNTIINLKKHKADKIIIHGLA